jgi:hypothetical protein
MKLRDGFDNKYYRVRAGFGVYAQAGHCESNTWLGSHRMFGVVYKRLRLRPGDQVHALIGGTFAVTKHGVFEVVSRIDDQHPFVKGHREDYAWPLDKLTELPMEKVKKPGFYRYGGALPLLNAGRIVGDGIHRLIEEEL